MSETGSENVVLDTSQLKIDEMHNTGPRPSSRLNPRVKFGLGFAFLVTLIASIVVLSHNHKQMQDNGSADIMRRLMQSDAVVLNINVSGPLAPPSYDYLLMEAVIFPMGGTEEEPELNAYMQYRDGTDDHEYRWLNGRPFRHVYPIDENGTRDDALAMEFCLNPTSMPEVASFASSLINSMVLDDTHYMQESLKCASRSIMLEWSGSTFYYCLEEKENDSPTVNKIVGEFIEIEVGYVNKNEALPPNVERLKNNMLQENGNVNCPVVATRELKSMSSSSSRRLWTMSIDYTAIPRIFFSSMMFRRLGKQFRLKSEEKVFCIDIEFQNRYTIGMTRTNGLGKMTFKPTTDEERASRGRVFTQSFDCSYRFSIFIPPNNNPWDDPEQVEKLKTKMLRGMKIYERELTNIEFDQVRIRAYGTLSNVAILAVHDIQTKNGGVDPVLVPVLTKLKKTTFTFRVAAPALTKDISHLIDDFRASGRSAQFHHLPLKNPSGSLSIVKQYLKKNTAGTICVAPRPKHVAITNYLNNVFGGMTNIDNFKRVYLDKERVRLQQWDVNYEACLNFYGRNYVHEEHSSMFAKCEATELPIAADSATVKSQMCRDWFDQSHYYIYKNKKNLSNDPHTDVSLRVRNTENVLYNWRHVLHKSPSTHEAYKAAKCSRKYENAPEMDAKREIHYYKKAVFYCELV